MTTRSSSFGLLKAFLLLVFMTPFQTTGQILPDTTAMTPADSLAISDSLRSFFLPDIGSFQPAGDSTQLVGTHIAWSDAAYLGQVLEYLPGVYLREMGSAGPPAQINYRGIDWRGVSLMVDGRPMNDPVTGVLNLYDIPIEFVDRLEVYDGAESFLFGSNGTGATMNVVTRQYNTGRPITKIRFLQGPNEHLMTDAFFTQNVVRGLNVMLGVQRQVNDGRFRNSAYDSWNTRMRLRYNVSERLNMSLMDMYSKSVTGLNNGINVDSTRSLDLDPFNEAEAIVYSENTSLTVTRRDVTLSAIATLFADTTWATKAAIFYSTAERAYDDPTGQSSTSFDRFSWNLAGMTLRQTFHAESFRLQVGGQTERRDGNFARTTPELIKKSYSSWFGKAETDLLHSLQPAVFARGESFGAGRAFSYGTTISFAPFDALRLSAGYSDFHRFPTFQESNWPSYGYDPQKGLNLLEHHRFLEFSATLRVGTAVQARASYSERSIENALLYKPVTTSGGSLPVMIDVIPDLSLRQFSGELEIHRGKLGAKGGLTFTEVKEGSVSSTVHPKFILTGELYYKSIFFDGALNARFGVQSRYVSRHQGVRFISSPLVYVENPERPLSAFSTFDVFGVFNIGDAFVSVSWNNPIDKRYYTVYPYPAMDRNITININWVFLN